MNVWNLQKNCDKCPMLVSEVGADENDEGSVGAVLTGSLLLDVAQDVPSFVENVPHNTADPNLQKCEKCLMLDSGSLVQ